jgi:hypothetical protein
MKKIIILSVFSVFTSYASAQCTLSGLNSFYCASDTISVLTASCNGTPTIFGPGVTSNGNFNPGTAGTGPIDIYVLDGTPTYTVNQTGQFDTIGPPGNATTVSLGDDDVAANLNIGFTFNFYGTPQTKFGISSNGFVIIGTGTVNGCCSGQSIPNSSTPNSLIAFAWEDLDPDNGNAGTISYWTMGSAPNRRCIIDFNNVPHYPGSGYYVTSQVHLIEGCGRIEIHTTAMPSDGGSHTMGVENSSGSAAVAVSGRNASSWSITNDYVSFEPNCGDTFSTYVSGGAALSINTDSLDCYSDTTGSLTVTATGSAPLTYTWSTGATTATVTGLGGGMYTVTVSDSAGCESDISSTMYTPPILFGGFTVTNNFCQSDEDGAIAVSGTGGVFPYTYAWSNGGTTNSISNLASGIYTATVTDANNCEKPLSTTVGYDHADPSVNLGPDKLICPNQSTVLVAPPGFTSYEWNDGTLINAIVISGPGTYSVTATNNFGCSGSDTVMVGLFIPDQVNLGPNLSGVGPYLLSPGSQYQSYFWQNGSTSPTFNVTISGEYKVTVQDTQGCVSSDSVRVKIWAAGISESINENIKVFPIPTELAINIDLNETVVSSISLYDMGGRLLKQMNVPENQSGLIIMSLESLENGNYLLMIEGEFGSDRRIISKQ